MFRRPSFFLILAFLIFIEGLWGLTGIEHPTILEGDPQEIKKMKQDLLTLLNLIDGSRAGMNVAEEAQIGKHSIEELYTEYGSTCLQIKYPKNLAEYEEATIQIFLLKHELEKRLVGMDPHPIMQSLKLAYLLNFQLGRDLFIKNPDAYNVIKGELDNKRKRDFEWHAELR